MNHLMTHAMMRHFQNSVLKKCCKDQFHIDRSKFSLRPVLLQYPRAIQHTVTKQRPKSFKTESTGMKTKIISSSLMVHYSLMCFILLIRSSMTGPECFNLMSCMPFSLIAGFTSVVARTCPHTKMR